jgi:hypothetical protein
LGAAANQDPYASYGYFTTSVNRPVIVNVSTIAGDPDGDPISLVKVGTVKYGTITMSGTIVTYTPTPALVNPTTGAKEAFSYNIVDGRGGKGGRPPPAAFMWTYRYLASMALLPCLCFEVVSGCTFHMKRRSMHAAQCWP